MDYLNEFTERRRLKVYFANEQSIFYGAPVGYVNVGRGNFTFVRRDLVTVGRIPLVLARVYDSSFEGGDDFGRGWHLSAAETIRLEPDGSALLLSESATEERFVPSGDQFVQANPCPTDIVDVRQVDSQHFQIKLQTGFVKEFSLIADLYRLTRVEDRNGNAVRLDYTDGKLTRLRGQNNRLIRINRDRDGRVASIRDDQDRSVHYRYDANGQLAEVIDLGGKSWYYEYDDLERMSRAIDPLRHVNFAVVYDEQGRVTELDSPTGPYRYQYDATTQQTRVIDGNGYESLYQQNADGITTAIKNPLGVETQLVLDGRNQVQRLLRNGAVQAKMKHDPQGRLVSLIKHERDGSEGDKSEELSYSYDERGRLREISDGAPLAMFSYDERGNLIERADADGITQYGYSSQGDLLAMSRTDGTSYRFEVDADGQITSVTDERNRQTTFRYYNDGKLAQTRFADGTTHSYEYNRLGMRRRIELDGGATVEYTYNPAGSLTEIQIMNEDGSLDGQSLTLDEDQKVRASRRAGGGETSLIYDQMGNLTVVSKSDWTMRFHYDAVNRLIEVVTPGGRRLAYTYEDGEPDLRLKTDGKTGVNASERVTSGLTFSSGLEVMRNRTTRRAFGVVGFDRALVGYRLTTGEGVWRPDAVPVSAIARMRVLGLGGAAYEAKKEFEAPSNVLFLAAEYWAINCCFCDGPACEECPEPVEPPEGDCSVCFPPPPESPLIVAISPDHGTAGTQINATISGFNLTGASSVEFDDANVTATILWVTESTEDEIGVLITINSAASAGSKSFTVFAVGGESNPFSFAVRVPHHLQVAFDGWGPIAACATTIARVIEFRVVDVNNDSVGRVPVQEEYLSYSGNTCGNGDPQPSGCADTDNDGGFQDTITVNCNIFGGSCGYSITWQWQWCPSGGSPTPLGTLVGDVQNSAVTVNGVTTPGGLGSGTNIFP